MTTAPLQKDVYKYFHRHAYHPDVTEVYSNMTNRSGKYSNSGLDKVCFVGLQHFIMDYLIGEFGEFFKADKAEAVEKYRTTLTAILGDAKVDHIEALHDLQYLPLEIKALPEGTMVPYGVPSLTVKNTHPDFFWLTNMIETVMSAELWATQTAATTAVAYHMNFLRAFRKCALDEAMIPFMGHDFSFRGMMGRHAAALTGFGHLAGGFAGTDTIPAVLLAEKSYYADLNVDLVGASVPATEHSVTCSWQNEGEEAFYSYLMDEVPTGILSLVFDTWDFWGGVTELLPKLKDKILARDGTTVIRPDSGDPVRILAGYQYQSLSTEEYETFDDALADVRGAIDIEAFEYGGKWYVSDGMVYVTEDGEYYKHFEESTEHEVKGLMECLLEIFPGDKTENGYRTLNPKIGAIYGDSITLDRQERIIHRLMEKKIAPTVVLGIGSYTYQYVTRDTHGSAVKATAVRKGPGNRLEAIFKAPKTDAGKTSAKGYLRVEGDLVTGDLVCHDEQTPEQEAGGLLETVFLDGHLVKKTTLTEIRERTKAYIESQLA